MTRGGVVASSDHRVRQNAPRRDWDALFRARFGLCSIAPPSRMSRLLCKSPGGIEGQRGPLQCMGREGGQHSSIKWHETTTFAAAQSHDSLSSNHSVRVKWRVEDVSSLNTCVISRTGNPEKQKWRFNHHATYENSERKGGLWRYYIFVIKFWRCLWCFGRVNSAIYFHWRLLNWCYP